MTDSSREARQQQNLGSTSGSEISAQEHVRWIVQQANENGRWHLSGSDIAALEVLIAQQEGSALREWLRKGKA